MKSALFKLLALTGVIASFAPLQRLARIVRSAVALLALIAAVTQAPAAALSKVYYITAATGNPGVGDSLWSANSDGSGSVKICDATGFANANCMALDLANNRAFVGDNFGGAQAIYTVNLTTGAVATFLTKTNLSPAGMEVDTANGFLYYITQATGNPGVGDALWRVALNGAGDAKIQDNLSIQNPNSLALDVANNRAFVADSFSGAQAIYSINLTTGAVTTFLSKAGLTTSGMRVDSANGYLYYITAATGNPGVGDSLWRVNLNGTGDVKIQDNDTILNPNALELDLANNRAIVADSFSGSQAFYAVNLTTAAVSSFIATTNLTSRGIILAPVTATTQAATSVTGAGATLNGLVNTNSNPAVTVSFDYGTTTAYGTNVAATPSSVSGSADTAVSAAIAGLSASTTYHYRVRTTVGVGADMTFTTSAGASAAGVLAIGSTASNQLSSSLPYTVPAGTNRLLVVWIAQDLVPAIPAPTFNGQAMTLGVHKDDGSVAGDSIYYLVLGNGDKITSTITGTANTAFIGARAYTNVDQTTPVSSPLSMNNTSGGNDSTGLNVVSATGDLVIDMVDVYQATAETPGGGQTILHSQNIPSHSAFYQTSTKPGAASVNMSWTSTGGTSIIHAALNIKSRAAFTAPTITTAAATGVTATTATINGTLNAQGTTAVSTFDLGLTTGYGINFAGSPVTVTGSSGTAVTQTVNGLTPNTTYHYRANAINGTTVNGTDLTFTTAGTAPTVTATTTAIVATATTVTITGTNFDTVTPGNNTVVFSPAGTGTVTAASATTLTVSSVTGLRGGPLSAVVTNGSGNSGAAVQVANVAPVITVNTGNITTQATQLTINGVGFDPVAFGNNSVVFSPAGTGGVAGSTSGALNVTSIAGLTAGALNAVVTTNGVASASVQVATVLAPPNLTINDVTLNEGNAGTTSFSFTVSLSAPAPAGGVTFDIATSNNTAVLTDYTGKSLTSQTIPAGSSTYTFTVLVNGDTSFETNETFFVNVTNVSGAVLSDGQGVGTIVNDDAANADLSALTTTATGLTPAFAANTLAYNATVTNVTTTTTVTATRFDATSTLQVQVNGGGFTALTSGSASGALALNVGSNPIDIKVTAQDGTTIKTYTITVVRASNSTPVASSFGDTVTGAGAPGTAGTADGTVYNILKRGGSLSYSGGLVFPGTLVVGTGGVTSTDSQGLWRNSGSGLYLAARNGSVAAGTSSGVYDVLPDFPSITSGGDASYVASLRIGSGSPAVTSSNDTGVWTTMSVTGTNPVPVLAAREGSALAPPSNAVMTQFASTAVAAATNSKAMTFMGTQSDGKSGFYVMTMAGGLPSAAVTTALEGSAAPGAGGGVYGSFISSTQAQSRMDSNGNFAFTTRLGSNGRSGVWYAPIATGSAAKVAYFGDAAPGTTTTFTDFSSMVMGGVNTLAFQGSLAATGDNASGLKSDGVWAGVAPSAISTYSLLLRRGDSSVTGLPASSKVGKLLAGAMTTSNHVAWLGEVDAGGDGTVIPAAGDVQAIYHNLTGTMQVAVKQGDSAPGLPGAVFTNLDVPVVGGVEQVAFVGTVSGGGAGTGSSKGIWRSASNGGALSLVMRAGSPITTSQGVKTISDMGFTGSNTFPRYDQQNAMDSTGKLLVQVSFTDGSTSEILIPASGADITCGTVTVSSPGTTTGTKGSAFSQTFTQTGGLGPVTYSTASVLPTGLSLSASGTLSGTPSQNGTFPITVNVIDSTGCSGGVLYTLVINAATAPEINLKGNGTTIASGSTVPSTSDFTDFSGTAVVGSTVVRTFTIENTGTGSLLLTGTPRVVISGAQAADFTVTTQPGASVAAAGSTTFQITFDPSANGLRSASVSISNDDGDEQPYTFNIQGTGVAPEIGIYKAAGSFLVSDGASWLTSPATYTGAEAAAAVFGGTSAEYATSTNSGTTITSTAWLSVVGSLGGVEKPDDFKQGSTYATTGNASAYVKDNATGATYTNYAWRTITATAFATTSIGSSSTAQTYTVKNSGTGTLTISGITLVGTNPGDFTLNTSGTLLSIPAGGQTTFTVAFSPTTSGARQATLRVANNDTDEGTTDIALSGTAPIPPPTITSIATVAGPLGGGTSVVITGTNFATANAVSFGGTAATSFNVDSDTQITAIAPAKSAGVVDITVTTPTGTSATSTADQFRYVAIPTITLVAPQRGPLGGGTDITITGTNFIGVTGVTVGGASATNVNVVSATSITCKTPAGSAGTASVVVSAAGGQNVDNTWFRYVAPPTLTNSVPIVVGVAGGASVTLTGTNLTFVNTVLIGSNVVPSITPSANSVTFTAPAGTAGTYNVTVTSEGGTSTENVQLIYVAAPTVTGITPSLGPVDGGAPVTITGTNFINASVTIGGSPATNVVVVNSTTITCLTPSGGPGAPRSVVVTTPGGSNAANALYGYVNAPYVLSTFPKSGPTSGGTVVSINGGNFTGVLGVTFNGVAATNVSASDTVITCTAPAGSEGTVAIVVTAPGGTTTPDGITQFTYVAKPTVTGLSPNSGTAAGSTVVTITGTKLTGATGVTFGTTAATSVVVLSATQVQATSPAGTGVVDVKVTTIGGTSATAVADQFSYLSTTQAIASVALTQNKAVTSFTPVTGSGGTGSLSYSVSPTLPTGLSLSTSTGAITGTPTVASGATTYTVTARDTNNATNSQTFSLTVNTAVTATQAVASKALTQSQASTNFTPVTGAGGTGTLTYSVSPALPTGLTLNTSTGAITGTPTASSSATTYTVTATDTNSATASSTFSLTVNSAVTATQSVASKTLTQSQPSANFTPVTGGAGTTPLSYAVSPALPTGLSLSTSTGAVTGVPTGTLSATTYTVTVTDSNNVTAINTFSLTINTAVTATQAVASKELTQGKAATSFTPVTGGAGVSPFTYSVSPALPTGLSLSTSTGAITGTASGTSSATTYTVTVTDSNSATATNTFSLTVNSAVTATQAIASKSLTQGQPSANFTPVTGGSGTGTLSYSVSPALPTGLSLSSSTGAVTGSPTGTLSATTYTVTVTDTNSATDSKTFSLTINTAVTATQAIASKSLTQGQPSTNFTPVTGSSGTGTLSYSVSPALPTGLSLSSSTGAVTGSPTGTSSATTYTVTVTDSNSATTTQTFSLTVNGVVTATQAIASTTLTQGQPSANFTPVTGASGTGTLSYSVSPALPTGLSLSSSTGAVTGSPTGTLSATTYTVTVTDSNSATDSKTFSLTINSAVTATQAIASKVLTRNQPSANFTPVTGGSGTGTLSYSVSPTLPTGLSLSTSTGAITGIPSGTSSATIYTVTVTDSNSATASNTFSLTVNSAVTATQTIASKSLTLGQPSANFTPVTGGSGTGTLSYSISPALPTGLSLSSSTGAITGTPSGASTATTYTITVTDSNSAATTQTFSLTVNDVVVATQAIASTTVAQNQIATSFTPVTGSGGTNPLSYGVSPALPSGLSLSTSTGAITGTPSVSSVATTYTVTVTDGNSATASNTFSLTIDPGVGIVATTATAVEGGSTGTYTITRGGSSGDLTVGFQLDASSTATAGTDFTLSSSQTFAFSSSSGAGSVVIPNGSSTATLTLTASVETPNPAEAAETARLNLVAGSGYAVNASPVDNATVTIAANSLLVTTTDDSGLGSLRQAVLNANALGGSPVITFSDGSGGTVNFVDATPDLITLTGGELSITQSCSIQGPGAKLLVVSGNSASRVFNIASPASVVISGVTITAGSTGSDGGGVLNLGNLLLKASVITNCSGRVGGGLCSGLLFGSGAITTVVNCTISGNTASILGGGAAVVSSNQLTIINSTISGNHAYSAAGLYTEGTTNILSSTITANTANNGGGGVDVEAGTLTLSNTIVAGNSAANSPDISRVNSPTVTSNGYNLIGNSTDTGSSITWQSSDILNQAPKLAALADNGGPTQTHLLLGGSPALDAGSGALLPADTYDLDGDSNVAEALPLDQRGVGFPRVQGTAVDIGAIEGLLYTPSLTAATTNEDTQSSSGLVITANAADSGGTTHYQITSITGGTLYKSDGTTALASNDFITKAEGTAGLKFTPAANAFSPSTTFGFSVQAAISANVSDLKDAVVPASITVNPVADTPSITSTATTANIQSIAGLVITPNAVDGAEVTHFKISNIQHGTLYLNNGTTAISAGDFITVAQGGAGLKFTPAINYVGTTSFDVQGAVGNSGTGLSSVASASITVGTVDPTPVQVVPTDPVTGLPLPAGSPYPLIGQTGTIEMRVNIKNTTVFPLNGFRLFVDFSAYLGAQPSLRLYNSSSAPGVSPAYVDYPYPVAVGGTVAVKLEFYTSTRRLPSPFAPTLTVTALAASQVSSLDGSGVQPRIYMRPGGAVLLEWDSTPGLWYRVKYSQDMINWYDSPVPLQAVANRTQWLDEGAPLTMSHPSSVPSRFYRVNVIPAPSPAP